MNSMLKKIAHRLTVLACILMAGLVIALWNRSYQRADRLHWVQWQENNGLTSMQLSGFDTGLGSIQYLREQFIRTNLPNEISVMEDIAGRFQPGGQTFFSTRPPRALISSNDDSLSAALGFDYRFRGQDELSEERVRIAIPYWFIFCLIMVYPITHYIRGVTARSRSEHQARSLCPRCGEPLTPKATHCGCCDRPVVVVPEAG